MIDSILSSDEDVLKNGLLQEYSSKIQVQRQMIRDKALRGQAGNDPVFEYPIGKNPYQVSDDPITLQKEVFAFYDKGKNYTFVFFESQKGVYPFHVHENDEVIFLLEGEIEFIFYNSAKEKTGHKLLYGCGHSVYIKAGQYHEAIVHDPAFLFATYKPPL